ncbi:MAG: CHAP domain-containing protein [Clostridia bacterium]|nr:CHAP domain-containing protein [Clostridia bacterium]
MPMFKKLLSLFLSVMLLSVCLPAPNAQALSFTVTRPTTNGYGIVGEREITMSVKLSGGQQPFEIRFRVYLNDKCVHSIEGYCNEGCTMHYMPKKAGTYRMELTIADQSHDSTVLTSKIQVSPIPRYEYPETWEATLKDVELTGNLQDDMLAVAKSQLGYDDDNAFIMRDGGKHFYSRYGEWYGAPFAEWCVIYLSFCAHYANVPETVFPPESNAKNLMDYTAEAGGFHPKGDGYTPQKGDIIFLDYMGQGIPTHAGFVDDYADGVVYTVEGNTSQGVVEKEYALDYESLIGFGSFQALMDRAGI